ncbi:site-specific DNA-methyltransferase [Cellulomonas iranensis]|uniref:site-specific DNA-methyltransferase n=1 Tax=Cellulomonas iranensis TaxID=76862 RepID=UPI0013D80614|nr:site-specific DNA-methyltransferase [Cellulomonas iranensis]
MSDVVLSWQNDHRLLVASGAREYVWGEPDAHRPRPEKLIGTLGDRDTGPWGTVAYGDALDAAPALAQRADTGDERDLVRLVYIDPPYNTGKQFGDYADAMRDNAWLSMLRDRIAAVRSVLHPHASIWVHLDDSQAYRARSMLDQLLGAEAYVATVIWEKRTTRESRTAFSVSHDTILVYAPCGPKAWRAHRHTEPVDPAELRNRDNDPRGPWADAPFTAPGYRAGQQYVIVNPAGNHLTPPRGRSWFATEPVYRSLLADDRIWFPRNGAGRPRMKRFAHEVGGLTPSTIWTAGDVGTNDDAKRHLLNLFDHERVFSTPKPEELLGRIIHIATDPGDLVVDLFAGSGTTATAAHKMRRRWFVVERIAETIEQTLVPRLARVVRDQDQLGITKREQWAGGGGFEVVRCAPRTGRAPSISAATMGLTVGE